MNILILVLEIFGTIAFSVSGAIIAIRKNMDVFGVVILGLVTATGGGIIRDLILGITPPTAFIKPMYSIIAIVTSILTFLPFIAKYIINNHKLVEVTLLIMDSLGLGVFTVVGIKTCGMVNNSFFLKVFVGVLTGVGGGVLRDLFANSTPYIFVKHFYATASILGAILCVLLMNFNEILAIVVATIFITTLRLLAAKYHWKLPKLNLEIKN